MGIVYKIDVLEALKNKGYSTYKIRKGKIMGEKSLQQIREGRIVSFACLEKICELIECQPGDILEYVKDEKEG